MKLKNLIFISFLALFTIAYFEHPLIAMMGGFINFEEESIRLMPITGQISQTIDSEDSDNISYKANLAQHEGGWVEVSKHPKANLNFSGIVKYYPNGWITMMKQHSAQQWYEYLEQQYNKQKIKVH